MHDAAGTGLPRTDVLELLEKLFPVSKGDILRRYKIPDKLRVDYAVVDHKSGRLILVVEFKKLDPEKADHREELRARLATLTVQLSPLPVYFITARPTTGFRYFTVDAENQLCERFELPDYDSLVSRASARRLLQAREEQQDRRRTFEIKCKGLSALAVILAGSTLVHAWQPSWQFLAVAAVAVLAFLLPDVQEIKALGIELTLSRPKREESA